MTKWEMPGLVFNSVYICLGISQGGLLPTFFPPIKACATRVLSKISHACKKENPEIKQCENLPKIIPYYPGVSQEVIM